ncbi:SMI1/KNR4 family protein [Saccharibacillus alkalitolerans]|uniref:SMI1/KNR4 family protein n=1 Tax=Saccharibacillus alkalitolerans TaxID=2705290 RepID=A0ABX0FEA7_9BACL|nr:SMI1/KNR4 family protein [Saccharibacillus alkalitolerans]NGZ77412.1 SMI1/KNR4 family protein [Saccharibacillus alkalitolerans]
MWRIIEAYDQINAWIRASQGSFIELENGQPYRFARRRTFTGKELEAFEQSSGLELPAEYKRFLIGVGAVELFAEPLGAGIEIIGPDEIADFSEKALGSRGDGLYPKLLLAVSMPKFGCFGGFRPGSERDERYGVFRSAAPPKQGIEADGFTAFDDWLVKLVENRAAAV